MNGRKKRTLVTVALVIIFLSALLYTSSGSFDYYRTPSEVLADPELDGKRIRVAGKLAGEIETLQDSGQTFAITDDLAKIRIVYSGSLAPNVNQETDVIIEGVYDRRAGVIMADSALTKCPSKYTSK